MTVDPPETSAKNAGEDDACVHGHPVPPEEMWRYSIVRDAHAERDIANYVEGQAQEETVQHVERVKTEYVLGAAYEVWDVTTDKGRWWVITNLTNLYSQAHFPSLDYTLSFHIGLMMRMREDHQPAGPDPFDEVIRRRDQAGDLADRAVEAEEYQAVGMQLRECLLTLVGAMRGRIELPENIEHPKAADFVGWSDLLMNQLCPGEPNKELRQYLKTMASKTWQLVNWLTHHRHATQSATSIAAHACDTLIGHFVQMVVRDETDHRQICPHCTSRNIRQHFDIGIKPDGSYYNTCGACGWSDHPTEGA